MERRVEGGRMRKKKKELAFPAHVQETRPPRETGRRRPAVPRAAVTDVDVTAVTPNPRASIGAWVCDSIDSMLALSRHHSRDGHD